MATENNIKNFTAVDIEKYHKGLLSQKEMHDLEKAALDDPFLADALEGYAVAGVNATSDIVELRNRLSEKVEGTKVIPLKTENKNNFRLLKVAAMLVFVAGAAFLVYQFGFNKKTDSIVQNEPVSKKENTVSDSSTLPNLNPSATEEVKIAAENKEPGSTTSKNITGTDITTGTISEPNEKGSATDDIASTRAPAMAPAPQKSTDDLKIIGKATERKALAKEDVKVTSDGYTKQEAIEIAVKDKTTNRKLNTNVSNKEVAAGKNLEDQSFSYQSVNTFRGRVTDQNNIGVPFANVTNLDENAGTYTDSKGYFNLTYPDTVLTVQVRSIGFENNNVQLRNAAPTNQIILQDDRSSLSEVVITNQKPNLQARSNNNTMQLEEPEPADGWTYYDNYLLNNLNLPQEFKTKPTMTGEVLVSFEVNRNGEPVNFKVEKSLCKSCDKEAIRLIKDGPKWKQKIKNGRTTVTIPF